MTAQTLEPVVERLRALQVDRRWAPHVEAWHELAPAAARTAPWPAALAPAIRPAAGALGIEDLYTHQAEAIEAALGGAHVAVATGTASGKSLCYLLPLLDAACRTPQARALLIFPTKALAHDQLAALRAWDDRLPGVQLRPASYDGDTPAADRRLVRTTARAILTNPDMLHTGILPHHTRWAALFEGLTHVAIDEMHVYRGVFGSHVANVLRRLRRIARFYGAQPQFLLTSATIANPGELGALLAGAPVRVVDTDGSPRGHRVFVFYNPPIVDQCLHIRRSPLLEAEALARHFLASSVQTVVFARTRQTAELIVRYVSQGIADRGHSSADDLAANGIAGSDGLADGEASDGDDQTGSGASSGDDQTGSGTPGGDDHNDAGATSSPRVRGYRGGYMASERRAIEAALRTGRLRGVVATNALELGVDIGELDACIMAGYPGTIASTWQQAGRAGRRMATAAAVLVAGSSPLDQFIIRHPDYVLSRSLEHARLDPDNLLILLDHVRCAAFELPFGSAESALPFGHVPAAPKLDSQRPADVAPAVPGSGIQALTDAAPPAPKLDGRAPTDVAPVLPESDAQATEQATPALDQSGTRPPPAVGEILAFLEAEGVVRYAGDSWYWLADSYPAALVGLRRAGPGAVTIVERRAGDHVADGEGESAAGTALATGGWPTGGSGSAAGGKSASDTRSAGDTRSVDDSRSVGAGPVVEPGDEPSKYDVLGTVEREVAALTVHPGAVYLHDGAAYEVEALDWDSGRAVVVPTDGAIYTRASASVEVRPLRINASRCAPAVAVHCGELEVTSRATGYRRIRFRTNETIGWSAIDLPELRHQTGGYWFTLDDDTVAQLRSAGTWRHDPRGERGASWPDQRDRALARDGYRCRLCGAEERPGRRHDVHHIRPFREFGWVKGQNEAHHAANALDNLITLCRSCHRVAERALGLYGGLAGVGYALSHIAPLFLMCDARDLGVTTASHAPWTGKPTVVAYEQATAGVGFGQALFDLHEAIIAACTALISDCPCPDGCPSCVGPPTEQGPSAKAHALAVLAALGA